eukprot:365122-Chlamydomonas_euryale.AAC.9
MAVLPQQAPTGAAAGEFAAAAAALLAGALVLVLQLRMRMPLAGGRACDAAPSILLPACPYRGGTKGSCERGGD